ncbi:MAG: thioredoxin fold domain-containing protein [Verrucomicrobiales bacterium]|nr:thioredoxin family protein [Verrucomicrobiota bacterium JB025]
MSRKLIQIPLSLCLVAVPLVCTSCGSLRTTKPVKPQPSPFGATGIPPQLRGSGSSAPGGAPSVSGGDAESLEMAELTPEEDIIFTDPDNPEESLPELSTLFATSKKRGPWEESDRIARKLAAREGKPLLIWFTDSQRSPMCKAISQELFSTREFDKWASDHIIRLKVDSNLASSSVLNNPDLSIGDEMTKEVDVRRYVNRLKKQYKVLGHPTFVMLSPSGEVLGRKISGYKRGQADFYWGLIKQAEAASIANYEDYLKTLRKKGYRQWEDRRGRKVLAKLTGYSKGTLTLVEPDGTRCKTHEKKLSDKDRDWIDEQKRLRGIE